MKLLYTVVTSIFSLTLGLTTYAQKTPTDTSATKPGVIKRTTPQSDVTSVGPQLTPKSPTAAALSRYGEYPISLYTGLPTIEIPIYEFKVGSVTVPVKLTYHASGNKVSDLASWVGLGWSLQTGGMITRTVLGRPDEQSGSLGQPIPDPNTFYNSSCPTDASDLQMANLDNNQTDAQRDLFSYATPTGSNTFMLTPTAPGYVFLSPEPVTIATASGLSAFTLVDATGTTFRYADTEVTATNANTPNAYQNYTSTWYLSEVVSLNTSERATYAYSTAQQVQSAPDRIDTWIVNSQLNDPTQQSGIQTGIVSQTQRNGASSVLSRYPTEIQFPGGKIRFVAETTARADGSFSLDYVDVMGYDVSTSVYSLIKRYDLQFGTQTQPVVQGGTFLTGVRLLQGDATTLTGAYSFTYNQTVLPAANSLQKDLWGYYNNNPGTTLLQKRNYYPYQATTSNPSSTTLQIGDAVRDPDETRMQAGIIQTIQYPAGGYTSFDFETNRYLDPTCNCVKLAGGLRLKRLRNYSTANVLAKTKLYRYGKGESGVGTLRTDLSALSLYTPTITINYNQPYGTASPGTYSFQVTNFTSAPAYPLTPDEGSPVTYPEVAEYVDDGAGNTIGKTVSRFRDAAVDATLKIGGRSFVTSRRWDRGQLTSQTMTDGAGRLVARMGKAYQVIASGSTPDFVGVLLYRYTQETGGKVSNSGCYTSDDRYAPSQSYRFYYGVTKLTGDSTYLYDNDQSGRYTLKISETDYDPTFILPRETRLRAEGGSGTGNIILGTQLTYPQDFGPLSGTLTATELVGLRALQRRNAYLPVETVQYRRESPTASKDYKTGTLMTYTSKAWTGDAMILNGLEAPLPYQTYLLETDYTSFGSAPYQSSAQRYVAAPNNTFPVDPRFVLRLTMNSYDVNGNLVSFNLTTGSQTTYSYSSYTPSGGMLFSTLQQQTQSTGRLSAQSQSFTYGIAVLGPKTMTDAKGVTTSYKYDGFGRLQTILDKDNNVLKQYTYHYSTQP